MSKSGSHITFASRHVAEKSCFIFIYFCFFPSRSLFPGAPRAPVILTVSRFFVCWCVQRDLRYKSFQVWFEAAFNNEDLPPVLRDFVPLCDMDSVKRLLKSPRLAAAERDVTAAIRRCDNSAAERALSSVATLAQSIGEEIRAAALARAQQPAILQVCRRVQEAGDAHFRGVYESVWRTICTCDGIGCAEYVAIAANQRVVLAARFMNGLGHWLND